MNLPPYTIAAWVNPTTTTPTANQYILSNGGQTGGSYGFALLQCTNSGSPQWCLAVRDPVSNQAAFISIGGPINPGWTHLAGTWDGSSDPGSLKLYVDGTIAATGTPAPASVPGSAQNFRIGAPSNTALFAWSGLIDEATVHDRVLSPAEIQAIYDAGSAGMCKCELFIATAFEPPMGKKKKIGSTLPIKFRLFIDGVEIVSEEQLTGCPKLLVFLEDGVMGLPVDDVDDNVGDPDEGDCFRYSAPNWIYNLRLLPPAFMPQSCFSVEIEIGDCVLVPDNNFFETK